MTEATSSPAGDQANTQRLVGQIQHLLDTRFLNAALMGALAGSQQPAAQAAFALMAASGEGPTRQVRGAMALCHDQLCAFIRDGHDLAAAVRQARMTEPGRAAFERVHEYDLEQALRGAA